MNKKLDGCTTCGTGQVGAVKKMMIQMGVQFNPFPVKNLKSSGEGGGHGGGCPPPVIQIRVQFCVCKTSKKSDVRRSDD